MLNHPTLDQLKTLKLDGMAEAFNKLETQDGILRRDMPRKSDIKDYTQNDIEMIQFMVNSTPRKCLGYKTPEEMFIQKLYGTLDM